MRLYPDNLEEKIDFDKIKDLIREECTGVLGADFVKKIAFSKDRKLLSRLLTQCGGVPSTGSALGDGRR